ncbi:hypothetical protein DH2020_032303 [Rehmannia glutinosa]|uniref:CCHC-type domain-containing protein n=1 Tax=Rehmannia glutinosa TaxID=99300 RepID=A0ABR0VJ27_REHGL
MATEGQEYEEEPIEIQQSIPDKDAKQQSLCLVGKLWTTKSFNAFALLDTMKKIWKPVKGMTAREIETNLFSFQFNHHKDIDRILSMEPWHFDKHLLMLQRIEGNIQPSAVSFDSTPFWVRLYDLPLAARNEATYRAIGNRIGKFIEWDTSTGEGLSRSVRVRVLLNPAKPLRRGTKITISNGTVMWISIKYERLPIFCFACGLLGHLKRECEIANEDDNFKTSRRINYHLEIG